LSVCFAFFEAGFELGEDGKKTGKLDIGLEIFPGFRLIEEIKEGKNDIFTRCNQVKTLGTE